MAIAMHPPQLTHPQQHAPAQFRRLALDNVQFVARRGHRVHQLKHAHAARRLVALPEEVVDLAAELHRRTDVQAKHREEGHAALFEGQNTKAREDEDQQGGRGQSPAPPQEPWPRGEPRTGFRPFHEPLRRRGSVRQQTPSRTSACRSSKCGASSAAACCLRRISAGRRGLQEPVAQNPNADRRGGQFRK